MVAPWLRARAAVSRHAHRLLPHTRHGLTVAAVGSQKPMRTLSSSSAMQTDAVRIASLDDAVGRYGTSTRIGAFDVVRTKSVPSFDMLAIELIHRPSGAKMVHLARPDPNNSFAVAFQTLPSDSTGVPHILEHTVLCGSQRYPCRDPFFNMLNRSLSNFMNAMTASDMTIYPFATTNQQDYYNLMDVYIDACFFPNLNEMDFLQEGWRLEHSDLDDPSSPLIFKGVVFNEMKGALSSTDMLFYQRAQQALFPNTTYSHVSGGEPLEIVDLTWEGLKAFHRTFYSPGNAKFLTYGDIPLEETVALIEQRVLSRDTAAEEPSAATTTHAETVHTDVWEQPRREVVHCQLDENGDERQTQISVKFLLQEAPDSYTQMCLRLLDSLLISSQASPFYKALIASGVAPGFSADTGLDSSTPRPCLSFGARGISSDQVEHIEGIILEILEKYSNEPFPEERVQSLLHHMQLAQQVVPTEFGLNTLYHIASQWNHSETPFDGLDFVENIARFKEEWSNDKSLFQKLIKKHLLGNTHRLTIIMEPQSDYAQRLEAQEAVKLAAQTSRLSEADISQLLERNQQLAKIQNMERDVSSLPTLGLEDIARQGIYHYGAKAASDSPVDVYTNVQPSNGVCYVNAFIDTSGLSEEELRLLPMFCQMLTGSGYASVPYDAFTVEVAQCMGGLSAHQALTDSFTAVGDYSHGIRLQFHCLAEKADEAFHLINNMLSDPRLGDATYLDNLYLMERNALDQVAQSGHRHAVRMALCQHSEAARVRDLESGFMHHRHSMDYLNKTIERDAVVDGLMKLKAKLFVRERVRIMITADNATMEATQHDAVAALSPLYTGSSPSLALGVNAPVGSPFLAENKNIAVIAPVQVSYAGCSVETLPASDIESAHLRLATKVMSTYLHKEIREQGGAYGAHCDFAGGYVNYFTYRDPTPMRSMQKFADASDWFLENKFPEEMLSEAKLACFKAIDAPVSVGSLGVGQFICPVDQALRQKKREEYLDATREDLLSAVGKHLNRETVEQSAQSVLATEDIAVEFAEKLGFKAEPILLPHHINGGGTRGAGN